MRPTSVAWRRYSGINAFGSGHCRCNAATPRHLGDLPQARPWRPGPCRQAGAICIFYKAYSKKVDSRERPAKAIAAPGLRGLCVFNRDQVDGADEASRS
jgi:antirestriction protein ArdC